MRSWLALSVDRVGLGEPYKDLFNQPWLMSWLLDDAGDGTYLRDTLCVAYALRPVRWLAFPRLLLQQCILRLVNCAQEEQAWHAFSCDAIFLRLLESTIQHDMCDLWVLVANAHRSLWTDLITHRPEGGPRFVQKKKRSFASTDRATECCCRC